MFINILFLLSTATFCAKGGSMLPLEETSRDCFPGQEAPLLDRFTPEQLQFFCQQRRTFDEMIFRENHNLTQAFTSGQLAYLSFLARWIPSFRAVRKELRSLSEEEMSIFVFALRSLKSMKIDNVSKYDLIVKLHHPSLAPGAHLGAAYLPWHREYLRIFEAALRQEHEKAALPYWASTLDEHLATPRDSIFWSEVLAGNSNGPVISGPARYWTIVTSNDQISKGPQFIQRNVSIEAGTLLNSKFVNFFLTRQAYRELTACVDITVERQNRLLHEWIGGTMGTDLYFAPQDFLYFLHHAYVDYLWEQFRRLRQFSRAQREQDYVQSYEACTEFHQPNAPMRPFNELGSLQRNIDGLSESFTIIHYAYEPPPVCSIADPNCKSQFLFCWTSVDAVGPRCVSKIHPNGNCTGFATMNDVCFKSTCIKGICALKEERS